MSKQSGRDFLSPSSSSFPPSAAGLFIETTFTACAGRLLPPSLPPVPPLCLPPLTRRDTSFSRRARSFISSRHTWSVPAVVADGPHHPRASLGPASSPCLAAELASSIRGLLCVRTLRHPFSCALTRFLLAPLFRPPLSFPRTCFVLRSAFSSSSSLISVLPRVFSLSPLPSLPLFFPLRSEEGKKKDHRRCRGSSPPLSR